MQTNSIADRYHALLTGHTYEPGPVFTEAFHGFAERYKSLLRYWALSRMQCEELIHALRQLPQDAHGNVGDLQSEALAVDLGAFPQTLRLSVLTMGLALVEDLLRQLSAEVAEREGTAKREPPPTELPFAHRYVLLLAQRIADALGAASAGTPSPVPQRRAAEMEPTGTTLAADLAEVLDQLATEARAQRILTDDDVDATLHHLGELVKNAELSYLEYIKYGES